MKYILTLFQNHCLPFTAEINSAQDLALTLVEPLPAGGHLPIRLDLENPS